MENKSISADFFMGANSPNGFYSLYDEYKIPKENHRSFLIKGGAGTGKSGIMKRIVSAFSDCDELVEKIHCSSDPNSLDGVILHTARCNVFDATPPHVIEPAYPGSFESIINLCEFFDEEKMSGRLLETVKYQTQNNDCHKKCRGLIRCADILLKDNFYYVENCTDFEKITALCTRICKAELPDPANTSEQNRNAKGVGVEHKRLLSAITNEGVKVYENTITSICDKIYLIKDEYGVSAAYLLAKIRDYALSKGYEIFSCYCPLTPDEKLEHIIIPKLKLGFATKTPFNDFSNVTAYKVINFTRFTDIEKLKQKKQFLSFNKRAAQELIEAAVCVLKEAKDIHDHLEGQYTDAVNFEGVNKKTQEVLDKIAKRY